MRFLVWLASQNADVMIRGLMFFCLSLFSPAGWLLEYFISPYLSLSHPSQWVDLPDQLRQLPPDLLHFKLLPGAIICLGLNVAFIVLCQRLSQQAVRALKQRFRDDTA